MVGGERFTLLATSYHAMPEGMLPSMLKSLHTYPWASDPGGTAAKMPSSVAHERTHNPGMFGWKFNECDAGVVTYEGAATLLGQMRDSRQAALDTAPAPSDTAPSLQTCQIDSEEEPPVFPGPSQLRTNIWTSPISMHEVMWDTHRLLQAVLHHMESMGNLPTQYLHHGIWGMQGWQTC